MQTLLAWYLTANLLIPLGEGVLTHYGEGDGFMGQRHAASWHAETPAGFPEVVTRDALGVAAPSDIPFGSRLRLTVFATCDGRALPPRTIEAVVVDRRADGAEGYYDAWPATFRALADPACGCVRVQVTQALSLGVVLAP
jgi:hypothetical protein